MRLNAAITEIRTSLIDTEPPVSSSTKHGVEPLLGRKGCGASKMNCAMVKLSGIGSCKSEMEGEVMFEGGVRQCYQGPRE